MKYLQETLKHSEDVTRLIMNSALDAIICINTSGEIIVWTQQAEKIFGWSESEVIGKQLSDTIIPDQHRQSHINGLKKYLETGEGPVLNKLIEIIAVNQKGVEFPVELTIVPVNRGEEIFFCSFIRDITKRKKAEQELLESELRYRSLIEQASDAIMITDTKGNFSDVNSSLCKLFGYTREELLRSNITALIDPEQLKNDPIRFDLLITGQPMLRERRMIHKNGSIIEVEANVKMIPDGRVLAIARDIRDRKKAEAKIETSEKKLRQVLSSTPDNFYVVDLNYNVILINETAEKNLGIAWGKPVRVGTNLLDVIPKTDEPIKESFEKVFAGEKVEYEMELSGDDLPSWLLVSFMPVHDEKDAITGAYVLAKDISERKKAEKLVKFNEQQLKLIYNTTADIIFLLAIEENRYKFISINQAFLSSTGLKEDQIVGKYADEVIPPSSRDLVFEKYKQAVESGQTVKWEEESIYPAGKRTGIVSVTPALNEYGECTMLVGNVHDITERKKAEEAIRESEEQYRTLVENAPEALVVFDVEKRKFVSVSESAVKFFKMPEEELLKLGPIELSPEFQPDGRSSSEVGFEKINEAIAGGKPSFEWTHRDSEGNLIPCEVRLVRLPSETQILIRGSIIDITERKKAEELVIKERDLSDTIINTLPGIFYLRSLETGKCLRWNKNFQTVLEYTPEEVAESILYDCIVEKDRNFVKQTVDKAFKKGEGIAVETEIITKSGKHIPYYLTGIPINYENQPCLMGTGIDITERKKAEELLIKERDLSDSIINTLPGVFYLRSLETGKLLRWNKNFNIVTGATKEELATSKLLDYIAVEDRKAIRETIEIGLKTGYAEAEAHILSKERNIIPYFLTGIPIIYEGQRCLLGTGIDISARKKAEEELRESEQKYKLLFESNPLPMFMFSKKSLSIIDVNESATRHYGYSRKEFQKMKMIDLRPEEDKKEFLDKVITPAPTSTNLGTWRHIKKDGTIITVEIIGYDINYEDKPMRLVLANDVTEKFAAEEKLKQSYNEVRRLTKHLQNIREEERTHIAREIHDELGQQLTVLKMDASWLNKKLSSSDEATKEKLKGLLEVLDGTVKTVRRISSELRPSLLDDLGLIAAIEWHLKEFEKRSGIQTNFLADEADLSLPDEMKTGLFRILQESLTNVARHAEAKKVNVILKRKNDELVLSIEDDGRGFDKFEATGKKTLGVLGMEERSEMMGGNYQIISQPGKGTVVTVSIPFKLEVNH